MSFSFGVLQRDWAVATLLRAALLESLVELRDGDALSALEVT